MPKPAVATQFHKTINVHRALTTKISLNRVIALDYIAKLGNVILAKRVASRLRVDLRFCHDIDGARSANAKYRRQCDLDPLVTRQIYTTNSSHYSLA